MSKFFIFVVFIIFLIFYYYFSFDILDIDKNFLMLSTFLFAIFSGFFIARQGTRYSLIREKISEFDGNMSSIYRSFGHFEESAQKRAAEIIINHYKPIIENRSWDYYLTHKTSTIIYLSKLLDEEIGAKSLASLQNAALIRIGNALHNAQINRKYLIALYQERIPNFQWFLIIILSFILFLALSAITSKGIFISSVVKSIFVTSIIAVIFLMNQLDKLKFFEGMIGESSAQDVLDIIAGKK